MSRKKAEIQKKVPQRVCAICRKEYPKRELIRFYQGKNEPKVWRVDLGGKAEGHGLYVCLHKECLEKLLKPRSPISMDETSRRLIGDLAEQSGEAADSEEAVLRLLGLAMRSGAVLSGYDATLAAIRTGELPLFIAAEDSAENSRNRLKTAARNYGTKMLTISRKEEIGRRLGRRPTAFCGINDKNFAAGMIRIMKSDPRIRKDQTAEEKAEVKA